ncbi:hypothetical protein ACQJBY_057723 [Aegilops geniculata]
MAGGDQPALRQVLMVAKACFVLGLVMAVIGLVAATSNPGTLGYPCIQSQTAAATEAEALRLRSAALTLVLLGVAQAMTAAAAVVVLAGGFLAFLGRCLVASALSSSPPATRTFSAESSTRWQSSPVCRAPAGTSSTSGPTSPSPPPSSPSSAPASPPPSRPSLTSPALTFSVNKLAL